MGRFIERCIKRIYIVKNWNCNGLKRCRNSTLKATYFLITSHKKKNHRSKLKQKIALFNTFQIEQSSNERVNEKVDMPSFLGPKNFRRYVVFS